MITTTCLLLACLFQCVDPAPVGIAQTLDQVLVFSDGAQTRVDVRRPQNTSTCGWPIVVLVHGIGGDRHSQAGAASGLASRGYFAVAYDVRGHGDHTGSNTHTSLRERKDLGELIAWAAADAESDPSRIGVSGASMGGMHAWMAAAWDGRPYEDGSGTFPDIDVVVAENISPDFRANFAPQASAVHCTDFNILNGNGVRYDATVAAGALSAILAQDYATWDAITAGPATNPWELVPSITCPVLAMVAYDDFAFPASGQAAGWNALPAGTPKKLYLGTGGHQSPANNAENALRTSWRNQWLDRWLKGASNGIDTGPAVTYAVTPDDVPTYLSANSTWQHRTSATWPPTGSVPTRWYLRAAGGLSATPPLTAESPEVLTQTVAPGFDMQTLVGGNFALGLVQANIPRNTVAYETQPLATEFEYAGDARVHLAVASSQTRWQVRARLVDVPPSGPPRYVAAGSYFRFDQGATGATTIDIAVNASAFVFRAGHKLRLELQNLQIHEPPTGSSLRFGPYVDPFNVEIRHAPMSLSWLELPGLTCPNPVTYGSAKVNSQGCTPAIATAGVASASSAVPFTLSATNVISQKSGLLFYGHGPAATAFAGGTLLVGGSLRRTGIQFSGGNGPPADCTGAFAIDFNAHIQGGGDPSLLLGTTVCAQYYYRDPPSIGGVGLTDAVQFVICP